MKCKLGLILTLAILLMFYFVPLTGHQDSLLNEISPPGNYITGSEADVGENQTFTEDQKLVATYYFYWYMDWKHRQNVSRYPASLKEIESDDVERHIKQLKDMSKVGIDIVLPVYWGNTSCRKNWSTKGLRKFVQAYRNLEGKGYDLPKIGMFHDIASMEAEKHLEGLKGKPDLTTKKGKEFFYLSIRDFYSLIPPRMRARINGKPIVWIYQSSFVKDYSQETFKFVNEKFRHQFGGKEPYVVRENSWAVETENVYDWGAALKGPTFSGIYSVGPGFNVTIPPIKTDAVKKREGGRFYKDSWKKILALSSKTDNRIVAIETWNEYHEETEVAETAEYGRKYLKITEEYIDKYKSGYVPENYPGKDLINADGVVIKFGQEGIKENGIDYVECADGKNKVVRKAGAFCLTPKKFEDKHKYMYFKISPLFKKIQGTSQYELKIEYYDSVKSKFQVQYDSQNFSGPHNGAYKNTDTINPLGTLTWREVTINLDNVNFKGRQNCGADFRIYAIDEELCLKSIVLEPK